MKTAEEQAIEAELSLFEQNKRALQDNRVHKDDLAQLLSGVQINGLIEIVDSPSGENQNEHYGIFHAVWVDQWSVGDSGDSFEGIIYGQLPCKKWLKVPYYIF